MRMTSPTNRKLRSSILASSPARSICSFLLALTFFLLRSGNMIVKGLDIQRGNTNHIRDCDQQIIAAVGPAGRSDNAPDGNRFQVAGIGDSTNGGSKDWIRGRSSVEN